MAADSNALNKPLAKCRRLVFGWCLDCYTVSRVDKHPKMRYNRKKEEGKGMATYSKEFKEEAIRLSDEIGNKKAAAQLGIPYYTLADWRNRSKHKPKETETMSEDELCIRNRELEREC